jgi:hypothetical protein
VYVEDAEEDAETDPVAIRGVDGRNLGDLSVGRRNHQARACRNHTLGIPEEPEKEGREQHRNENQKPTGKPVGGKKANYGSDEQQTDRIPISITNHAAPQGAIIRAHPRVYP